MEYKQEMPPPGGYAPITYEHVPLKTFFKPKITLACIVAITGFSWVLSKLDKRRTNNERIEMRCARQSITPLIQAEGDRMLLKQLKKNRDLEEELMKDVKGWEVGKYKHAPVYLSLDPDEYFKPTIREFYAHTDFKDVYKINQILLWT